MTLNNPDRSQFTVAEIRDELSQACAVLQERLDAIRAYADSKDRDDLPPALHAASMVVDVATDMARATQALHVMTWEDDYNDARNGISDLVSEIGADRMHFWHGFDGQAPISDVMERYGGFLRDVQHLGTYLDYYRTLLDNKPGKE